MNVSRTGLTKPFVFGIIIAGQALVALPGSWAAEAAHATEAAASDPHGDGQHDFDFEMGTWKTHLKRLLQPLSGSTTWVEYDGTSTVRKVWQGRASLLELEVDGAKRAH